MLNQCNFIGRVGKEPVARYTPEKTCIVNFSMAIDESYKKDGIKVEKVEWINVVAFKKLAEIIEKFVGKGDLLFIGGKIQTRKYQDKDGQEKYITEIVANEMKMLGTKKETSGESISGNEDTDLPF